MRDEQKQTPQDVCGEARVQYYSSSSWLPGKESGVENGHSRRKKLILGLVSITASSELSFTKAGKL